MDERKFVLLLIICLFVVSLLSGCGSSGSSTKGYGQVPVLTPVFTTTPVIAATQGVGYVYNLAADDPAGGSVSFALTTGPTEATLSGSTINWTPTAAESRISNNFEVTATTSEGGSATQSWTVTPGGTITVNWINNYWGASGAAQVPALSSAATSLSALWTNLDGSISLEKSSATATPGVFVIPNVPGGNYWLQVGTTDFWTNTSTFDAGQDYAGPDPPTTASIIDTNLTFDLSGLESVPELTTVNFIPAIYGSPLIGRLTDNPNSTTINGEVFGLGTDIDWSQINTAFFTQLVPSTLGSLNNLVVGPSLIATNLSLVDGPTNTITETLQSSPQASFDLSVQGSQWAPLLSGNNVAPSAPTPIGSTLNILPQMYVTQGLAYGTVSLSPSNSTGGIGILVSPEIALVSTQLPNSALGMTCSTPGFALSTPTVGQAAITTDQDFGTLQYGDPYPSNWGRTLTLCEEATAQIPIPNSTTSGGATFVIVDAATVAPSSTPVAPVVLPVQNPTIQGFSFFPAGGGTGIATTSNQISLAWTAPTGPSPFGYTVRVYVLTTMEGQPYYAATGASFSTAGTSITLPPLSAGNTYVFTVTANADGKANMQTAPFRSSLPTGYATVVSSPVTISAAAQMPAIHGDQKEIERLSQPWPQAVGKTR